jgi:hypothetical protein
LVGCGGASCGAWRGAWCAVCGAWFDAWCGACGVWCGVVCFLPTAAFLCRAMHDGPLLTALLCSQVLRATATLSTTVMFIPLVTTVVQLFNCRGTWGTVPSWQCFTSTHLMFCIVGAATIICFSAFSFVGTCHVLDSGPRMSCALTAVNTLAPKFLLVGPMSALRTHYGVRLAVQ